MAKAITKICTGKDMETPAIPSGPPLDQQKLYPRNHEIVEGLNEHPNHCRNG
ncbi:MAG: hypothetical protein U9O65_02680 [Thermotogota bacterium]|nr:hypothetical protein [Thermotogota bacterium]